METNMNRRPVPTLAAGSFPLVLLLCLSMPLQAQRAHTTPWETEILAESASQASSVVLKGVVVDEAGQPVVRADIWVYKADTDAYGLEVGEDGRMLNPTGVTDEEGQFEIEVARSFLPESRKIKLTIKEASYRSVERAISDAGGVPIVLTVDPDVGVFDISEVVGKIIV
jgi:hypothetical protein